jgi:uncharacterized protein
MRMREIGFEDRPAIDAYGPGGFRVGGAWHGIGPGAGLLLGPDGAAEIDDALAPAALGTLLALEGRVDVLLIGTGAEIAPLARALREPLEAAGLGVEAMATPPACRTYNVLLAEERRVAALLVAV